jgi:hypothetical protein
MTTREQFYTSWRAVRLAMGNAPMGRINNIPTRHVRDFGPQLPAALQCWGQRPNMPPGHWLGFSDGIPAAIKRGMVISSRLAMVRRFRDLRA